MSLHIGLLNGRKQYTRRSRSKTKGSRTRTTTCGLVLDDPRGQQDWIPWTLKNFNDTFSRFDTIPACDGDGQTDTVRQKHRNAITLYGACFLERMRSAMKDGR